MQLRHPTRRARSPGALVALTLGALLVAACGASTGAPAPLSGDGEFRGLAPDGGAVAGPAEGGGNALDGSTGGGNGDVVLAVDRPDLLIIKTGALELQVGDIDAALTAARAQVAAIGGYASGSERAGDGDAAYASITFRVPADRWDDALAALRGIATKVIGERSSTQDVTGQVVDLGARITNLQATERALQSIMDRATEIKDVLAVQQQLTQVRGEIEQLSAQKSRLEEQAAFSTLTVTLGLKPDPVLTSTTSFDPSAQVDEASARLVGILQAVATAGIWFAIVWLPILLTLLVAGGVVLVAVRRFGRRGSTGGPMGGSNGPAAVTEAGS